MTFAGDAAVCASAGVMRLAAIRAAAATETLFIMSIPIVTAAASCGAALARGTRPLVRSLRSCTIFIQQAFGQTTVLSALAGQSFSPARPDGTMFATSSSANPDADRAQKPSRGLEPAVQREQHLVVILAVGLP